MLGLIVAQTEIDMPHKVYSLALVAVVCETYLTFEGNSIRTSLVHNGKERPFSKGR